MPITPYKMKTGRPEASTAEATPPAEITAEPVPVLGGADLKSRVDQIVTRALAAARAMASAPDSAPDSPPATPQVPTGSGSAKKKTSTGASAQKAPAAKSASPRTKKGSPAKAAQETISTTVAKRSRTTKAKPSAKE
jgi:hypothetical protein